MASSAGGNDDAATRHRGERENTLRLLRLLNDETHTDELIRALTAQLQEWTGCEAVGVRLRDGDDYPYLETRGFPAEFVRAESSLCERDLDGQIRRDSLGQPCLECMCGNVIRGRTDPALPFFTAGGSFWSNCTTELLATTTEAERQARTRNRCNSEGYESVALVPLRTGGQTLGLLQFNDHACGRFTPELLEFLEGLAQQIAAALAHRQALAALRESEEHFRSLFDGMLNGVVRCRMVYENGEPVDFVYLAANPAFEQLTGLHDMLGKRVSEVIPGIRESDPELFVTHGRVASTGRPERFEMHVSALDMWVAVSLYSPRQGEFVSVFEVITERKRSEEAQAKLHAQFVQAQKMESVGRLAGGVAHDFNNMLQAILGYTDLALGQADDPAAVRECLLEIGSAARRSADLTSQLLAFARRQTVRPQVLDLNATVAATLNMLRRLIGEDVALAWRPAAELWPVRIDPSQLDQVLANLVVNARDAISGVGKVTIETANVVLDQAYCAERAGFVPGEYGLLSVSDTGCGMDAHTVELVFEPFFTTKGPGRGTGLGLSTVYGIVKQNSGFINVYSEVGQGTTFRIYLPRHVEQPADPPRRAPEPRRGTETVLLVEDETAVLKLGVRILSGLGYTVLAAATPAEALELAGAHTGPLHLLVTDVVMPEMNGRDLAARLTAARPGLKRLFLSGYPADVIADQGVLDAGVQFLAKPFTAHDLSVAVRDALDA